MEQNISARLTRLRQRIASACATAGRDPQSVRLLAISKLKPLADVEAAFAAGQVDFGENYVREAVEKIEACQTPELTWHFVGRIQSNKVRDLAGRFAVIHSIERLEIAERLDRASEARQDIFLQMNVANEASKAGVTVEEIEQLVHHVNERCPKLRMLGLMVMPPLGENAEAARPHFRTARETLARLKARIPGHPLDQLSMGTSGDFEVAIAEGATWIRIGTDVFGPRTRD